MNEEPRYKIGRGEKVLGEFDKWELMRAYNSASKCDGVWIERETRESLNRVILEWHGAQSDDVLIPIEKIHSVPLLNPDEIEGFLRDTHPEK